MNFTRTKIETTVRPENIPDNDADIIFISDYARKYSAKEGAALTDMTPNGFKKIQARESAISYKKLNNWLRRDPDFAAAHAAHVGLILPGEAEYAGALTRAFNAYARRPQHGGDE